MKDTMTPEEIAESCEQAAAVLEGHWTRGSWMVNDSQGKVRYCLEGGLAAALGLDVQKVADDIDDDRTHLYSCPVYQAVCDTVWDRMIEEFGDTEDAEYVLSSVRRNELYRGGLPNWNDTNYRTEQEVLDVLHATAKRVLGVAE